MAPVEISDSSVTKTDIFCITVSEKTASLKHVVECKDDLREIVEERRKDIEEHKCKISPDNNETISKRYFWSGGTGILFALINSCVIFCAWPQNHIYMKPNAWHEFMTTAAIGFIGLFAASLILNCEIWMNIKPIKTWKNFLILYLVSALAWVLSNIGYYHVYCVMLGFSPPMPLNIHVCGTFTLIVVLSFFWLLIPAPIRLSKDFRKRYGFYILAQLFRYVAVLEYFVLAWLFVTLDEDYQWVIAIILPVIREFNAWILMKICYKSAGTRNDAIKITSIHEMASRHAVFMCVALSLLATQRTAFICIALDFIVNLLLCIQIIWRTNRNKKIVSFENDTDLQVLVLNEKTVYVVPLAYFICFLVAYFGPNAWIIGNVGNTSWHFGKVEDLESPVVIMVAMFLVDLVAIALWAFILKIFCGISFLKGYMYTQKKYWLIMAIHEAYALNEVNNYEKSISIIQPL
jgi:hypothetical protein